MISVIIPLFNRPTKVHRAFDSVLRQRDIEEELEVIVVDDASNPPFTVKRNLERVRCIRLPKNLGPAGARNAGIRASKGQYLAFLDSDDTWLPDKLAHQLAMFRRLAATYEDSCLAVSCSYYYAGLSSGMELRRPRGATKVGDFVNGCWSSPGSTLFLHRSAFEETGVFDERLRRLEDYDWLLRFALRGGQLHVCNVAGSVVVPSKIVDVSIVLRALEILCSKYCAENHADQETALPYRQRRRVRAYLMLERAAAALLANDRLKGLGHLMRSFALVPRMQIGLDAFSKKDPKIPYMIRQLFREMADSLD